MVELKSNAWGMLLEWEGADGTKRSVSWLDKTGLYDKMLDIRGKQLQLVKENEAAKNSYILELDYWNKTLVGKPPVKPKQKVLTDLGVAGEVDFSPSLPDPKPALVVVPGAGMFPDHTGEPSIDQKLDAIMTALNALAVVVGQIAKQVGLGAKAEVAQPQFNEVAMADQPASLPALPTELKLNVTGDLPGEKLLVKILEVYALVRTTMNADLVARWDAVTVQQVEDMQKVWRGLWQKLGVVT